MNKNEKNSPLIILTITILILLLISFFPKESKIAGIPIKPVDLFMDIKPDSLLIFNDDKDENSDSFTNSLFAGNLNLNLLKSFISKVNNMFLPQLSVDLSSNTSQMSFFKEALKKAKTENVRVAHFGDSEIEGDLVTADLRKLLQQKFGGNGNGFLSITSQDVTFRSSVKHSFSSDWKTNTLFSGGDKSISLGIAGTATMPAANSWVKYETTGNYNLKSFNKVRLFYSNAVKSTVKYSFNNGPDQTIDLQPGTGIKEITLLAKGDAKSIKITATSANQAVFYGVSLENNAGIYVDNFPWRGNTGVGFRDIPEKNLAGFNDLLGYDLIILSFGGNMVNGQNSDYSWYESQMTKVVNQLKSIFPKTSIVLVSVGDKSVKRGTKFVTDPGLLKILEAQKNVANKTGVAFWNMFESMGGLNSMDSWVNSNPALAFKDYTHLTQQGAAKIADLLFQSIIK